MFDPKKIRADFPILSRQVHDQPLVYLDNAATSHKPTVVVEAMSEYYYQHNANVHRGIHTLSDESTQVLEDSRKKIAEFVGAEAEELILVRNATEALNGVAYGWADYHVKNGDVILMTMMEHHANLVVWQEVAKRTGARVEAIQVTNEGRIDLDHLEQLLNTLPVKLVAIVHVSNALGTVNPVEKVLQLIKSSQSKQAKICLDAAQSVPHLKVNFAQLGVDFMTFSGHKMLGPMGIGGLVVKKELLEKNEMRPWLFGGGMIESVAIAKTAFHPEMTERFTAGTPDVASTVGLAAAVNYLSELGMDNVEAHDRQLVKKTIEALQSIEAIQIVGPTEPVSGHEALDRIGSVAFTHKNVHAHDVAQILDSVGVAVRSGHHCTMPLHTSQNWQATTRASFQVYTTLDDIEQLTVGLEKVAQVFGE